MKKNQSIKNINIMLIIKIKLPLKRRFPPTRKKGCVGMLNMIQGFQKKNARTLKIKKRNIFIFKKIYNIVKYKR